MRLISPEFNNNGRMPDRFTCMGYDVNPELLIEDVPDGARTLALVVSDPDSIAGTWIHWLVYDIPVIARIHENSVPGTQGMNTFKKLDYGGPCPAIGTHRYYFTLYALDTELRLREGVDIRELMSAMEGHILGEAKLVGLFSKSPVPQEYTKINI